MKIELNLREFALYNAVFNYIFFKSIGHTNVIKFVKRLCVISFIKFMFDEISGCYLFKFN